MPKQKRPAPKPQSPSVCGIGASAGGIEALQTFFSGLPGDLGLAYVVIVHLAPDRKSDLPSLIRRWTNMEVLQVADHQRATLERDHVYVIAPDRKLEITDTSVGASEFDQARGQRAAIDLFFRSLAKSHRDGFAVVLSGSGSDGALGARAVKESGGLVLVQDPREAMHSDMPRAVIQTGVADVVLPVRELVGRLAELARGREIITPVVRAADDAEPIPAKEEKALRGIFDLLVKRTGHDFSKYKRNTVLRRLARRMQLRHKPSIADYYEDLRSHAAEVQGLFDDLLISVTSFFRDPESWSALQTRVIGPLVDEAEAGVQIRAWVPGCATGEEAYTLAILFHEEFERRGVRRDLIVFASDADESALAVAREGRYPQAILADVSEPRLEAFFQSEDDHYRIVSSVRDQVVFAAHSLLRDPPFSRVQLVSCRNLLIYLDRDLQEQAMAVFRYALRDRGYLFLGASEMADGTIFSVVDPKHRIFATQELGEGGRPPLPQILAQRGGMIGRFAQESRPAVRAASPEIHVAALEDLSLPSLIVDERWNVLHMSNSASRFLQQAGGPPAQRVTELVRPELRDELHALLHRAFESDEPRMSSFVSVAFNGTARRVAMVVQQRSPAGDRPRHALLTFIDGGEAGGEQSLEQEPSSDLVHALREKLRQAEGRIESIRDDYYLTNEDLRAANEELQSLNEEYRSTTEELETSKEELQSINEELQTVNHELKLKLEEVSHVNSDLENLMAATEVATLFLDRECRISRFTPRLSEIFSIRARDRERPIPDLTHRLEYDSMEADARKVLDTQEPMEREVSSRDGRIFSMRLRPYRKVGGGEVDGVVVTFIDVTGVKSTEKALRESEQRLAAELDVTRRLHRLTTEMAGAASMETALDEALDTMMALAGAEFGNVQLLDAGTKRLRVVTSRGFRPPFLKAFESVAAEDESSCGRALRTRQVVCIEDIASDRAFAPYRALASEAGYRAVMSVPLIAKDGNLVGVLSIHFRLPRTFPERDRQLADVVARQVADMIVIRTQQEKMQQLNEALIRRTTDMEEKEERLSRQAAQLLEQDRKKETFLASLGHELRNPMAAITSSLELLEPEAEPSRRAAAILKRQATHMSRLVNDLVDVARINRGELRVIPEPVDLNASVLASVETARADAERKGLFLEAHLPDPPLHVTADPERLQQILQNLLGNAVKFTEHGGITVNVSHHKTEALIAIRDTGIGIDPKDAATLFDEWHQTEDGLRRGGFGLGLSLVKRLVDMHEGHIEIHSKGLEHGSEAQLRLPLATAAARPAEVRSERPAPRRILIVDDRVDVADALGGVLEHMGHSVRIAYDGEAALAAARTQKPQVALVDLSMPGMGGDEVARRLREQFSPRELTLVAVSGYPPHHPSFKGSMFDHHLLKPITSKGIDALLSTLATPRAIQLPARKAAPPRRRGKSSQRKGH